MTGVFAGLMLLDGWLDGSITLAPGDDKPIQGSLLMVLVLIIMVLALLEFSKLISAQSVTLYLPVAIPVIALLVGSWYFPQFLTISKSLWMLLVPAGGFAWLLVYHYRQNGIRQMLANCGLNCFAMIYFGIFGACMLAIRIEWGLWAFLMFVFVIKFTDIGAYSFGKGFGKHPFSPLISPKKTWEGMFGGILAAVIVSLGFAHFSGIMNYFQAGLFGVLFAFIGQLGDLAESMIKRDVQQKDASGTIPGFGGILDVIDSPLLAAPAAYVFMQVVIG